ncbi:transposase, partial [Candidatus Bathyarchaeota archaeon]|nr:transposase [Candidatus Bathyarchaeota archaeon]
MAFTRNKTLAGAHAPYTSQKCSRCGKRGERKGKTFTCADPTCGLVLDSDLSAARNVGVAPSSPRRRVPVITRSPFSRKTAVTAPARTAMSNIGEVWNNGSSLNHHHLLNATHAARKSFQGGIMEACMVDLELSAITDEFSLEFDEVCEHLQDLDVGYVELRKVWVGNILEIDDRTVGDAKDILDDAGLKVASLAGPLLKVIPPSIASKPLEPTNYSKNWKYNYSLFNRALELASTFKTRYIRCFGYNGSFNVPPVEQWDSFKVYQDWAEVVDRFASQAAEQGKMLICENEGGLNKHLHQMEFIGKRHCGPGFGLLYDTANVAIKDGESGILTESWLPKIAPCIQYVHAKGCQEKNLGGRTTCLVNGKKDICRWPRLVEYFSAMEPGDFIDPPPKPLFLSIETHMGKKNRWENSTASLKNLQALLKLC